MEDWKIHTERGRQGTCHSCGVALAGFPDYFVVLRLPECVRRETCPVCFQKMQNSSSDLPFYWKMRRRQAGKKEATLDLSQLRGLFDRLGEPDDESGDESGPEQRVSPEGVTAEVVEDTAGQDTAVAERDAEAVDADANQPTDAAGLRYLVALLLLRKRVLRLVDPTNEQEEQADLLVVDPKIEGMQPVALTAPDIDSENLQGLREELLAVLEAAPQNS